MADGAGGAVMRASFWDRYGNARVSRRRLIGAAGVGGLAAGAVALAGCGRSSADAKPTQRAQQGAANKPDILNPGDTPRRGGTLYSANSAAFGTFDPHTGVQVASAYFPRVYNLLLSQSATKPEFIFMDLATAYENPDETTYVFHIRPGVKVAPNDLGVPERDLDGDDVRVTLERLRTDATTNQYSFANKFIASVDVNGDTVTVRTTEPYAWFIPRISSFFGTIPPRELLMGDLSRMSAKTAGGGPFRLVSVTEGDLARFTRNPNYYRRDDEHGGEQLPYVDNLEVRVIFDRATQRTAFRSGQIDLYWAENSREVAEYGDLPVAREPVFNYISITMNAERRPFQDPRVRRAISRAIDRQQYIDIVYGGDAKPNGIVHWPLGSYALPQDELASTYQPYDPADARALIDAVGGIRIKMNFPANTTIQEHGQILPIFVQQMERAGIQVEQQPLEFTNWVSQYHDRDYDSSLALNQIYETPELPLLFHTTSGPFGDGTYIKGLGDAEIDAAVKKANTTIDLDARRETVLAAQKLIYAKDPMFLPLVGPYQNWVYQRRVRNVPVNIGSTAFSLSTWWLDA